MSSKEPSPAAPCSLSVDSEDQGSHAHPECKVVFIGPCAAKKLEASRHSVRSDVDFVLTFEEMNGIFDAKGIDLSNIEPDEKRELSSADGQGFAVSGGVANAVKNVIAKIAPDREVKVASAEGLAECKKMLMLAKAGKYELLEDLQKQRENDLEYWKNQYFELKSENEKLKLELQNLRSRSLFNFFTKKF